MDDDHDKSTRDSNDGVFESTVLELIQQGVHARRGLTAEEYISACKKAWDSCQASSNFPFKILIDPLQSVEDAIANSNQDYIHYNTAKALRSVRSDSTEIRCEAIGFVHPDLSREENEDSPLISEEPDLPESRQYMVGVFDVLGFSARLELLGLKHLTALYDKLISEAVMKDVLRTFGAIRLNDREVAGTLFALPVRHTHFSDTIILWVPLVQHFIAPFMARCADLVCEALKLGLPLRGALSAGRAVLHSRSGTFIGQPIVEAARLEQAQNWVGVSLCLSMLATDITREFDPNLVLSYEAPTKRKRSQFLSGVALDWPRRFLSRHGNDPKAVLLQLNNSTSHRHYYENAAKFVDYSVSATVRREGMRPLNLSDLAAAAVEARTGAQQLDQEHESELQDLSQLDPVGTSLAEFLNAIAKGEEAPQVPSDLPLGLRRYLKELSLASKGSAKYFKVNELVIDALHARQKGVELGNQTTVVLDDLEKYGRSGSLAAKFIRELSARSVVTLPKGLQSEWRRFLRQALEWADGKVPSGVLQHLANESLQVRFLGKPLSEYDERMLEVLAGSGETWRQVVYFLREVLDTTKSPVVPSGLPERIERQLIRVREAASLANVQSPRILELMSIGIGDPCTNIDLFALAHHLTKLKGHIETIPSDLEIAISEFEAAAPERAIVGKYLRALATGVPPNDEPCRLPAAIEMIVAQLDALSNGKPIPLALQHVGWSAIRSRHGGSEIGDCVRFSLILMLSSSGELNSLAQYFWKVANGGPAVPIPEFSTAEHIEVAEEIRNLADKDVGGFRLAVSRADPTH